MKNNTANITWSIVSFFGFLGVLSRAKDGVALAIHVTDSIQFTIGDSLINMIYLACLSMGSIMLIFINIKIIKNLIPKKRVYDITIKEALEHIVLRSIRGKPFCYQTNRYNMAWEILKEEILKGKIKISGMKRGEFQILEIPYKKLPKLQLYAQFTRPSTGRIEANINEIAIYESDKSKEILYKHLFVSKHDIIKKWPYEESNY